MQCALTPTHERAYARQLSNVNPELFAVAIHTVDGQVYWRERACVSVWLACCSPTRAVRCTPFQVWATGDFREYFTVQSCCKPVAFAIALRDRGHDVNRYVGHEPSGKGFNVCTHARPLVLQSPPTCPLTPLLAVGLLVESRPQTIQPIDQLWSHRDLVVAVARARPCRGTAAPAARHILVAQHLRSLADLVTG